MSGVPWKVRRRNQRLIERKTEQNQRLRQRLRMERLRTLKEVYVLLRDGESSESVQQRIVRWIREEGPDGDAPDLGNTVSSD